MAVSVVDVREMGMAVRLGFVPMVMVVPGSRIDRSVVGMLVVRVVDVLVVVLDDLVQVFVHVALCQVQPDSCKHQPPGHQERHRDLLAHGHGECRTKERRDGKVRPGAGSAEVAQANHEQRQADPVGKKTNHQREPAASATRWMAWSDM